MFDMNKTAGPSIVKDPEYFFEDGNCVISVEGTFFNLHRTILRKNSNFFRDLFLLPRAANPSVDGQSADQPIICHDSVEEFRAWCSALYAGFNDSEAIEMLNEEEIARIGLIAHKYGCDAMERWAAENILKRFQTHDHGRSAETVLSPRQAEYLLGVVTQCSWPSDIRNAVEAVILDSISEENPHRLRDVIRIADNVGSEVLKARAYYHFLRSLQWSLSPTERDTGSKFSLDETSSKVWCDSLEYLTTHQMLRLHHGFVGLSALRGCLRNIPWVNNTCTCLGSLRKRWRKEADIHDYLKGPKEFVWAMREGLDLDYRHSGACGRLELGDQLNNFLDTFDDNLVKFFPKFL